MEKCGDELSDTAVLATTVSFAFCNYSLGFALFHRFNFSNFSQFLLLLYSSSPTDLFISCSFFVLIFLTSC